MNQWVVLIVSVFFFLGSTMFFGTAIVFYRTMERVTTALETMVSNLTQHKERQDSEKNLTLEHLLSALQQQTEQNIRLVQLNGEITKLNERLLQRLV